MQRKDEHAFQEDERGFSTDEIYMAEAIALARQAEALGEVPIGAVVVSDGTIIGRGHNQSIQTNDPSAHAEMIALRQAAQTYSNYRLTGTTLYVTLEPCAMCAGLLVNARVARLVFGARDLRFGGVRSKFQIADSDLLNHRVEVVEGVMGGECSQLLEAFFRQRR